MRSLEEMSLKELRQLFPICLRAHNDAWSAWYEEEASAIRLGLNENDIHRISHVGSTSVQGIWAKPIVDILLEIKPGADMKETAQRIQKMNWRWMCEEENRISFKKGYTPKGFAERVFHLHVRRAGDCDELYFRDYLREHALVAAAYEQLKLALWKEFEFDRDGYTNAKTDFIRHYTIEAKQLYCARYEVFAGEMKQ